MANLKDLIYLSNEDYETLVTTGTVTIDGETLTYNENNLYVVPDKLASTTEDGLMSAADKTKLDNLPKPMVYKGTLGTGGTITDLPAASSSNEGYTYKVITAGTYASTAAKVGDVFISNGSEWTLIPAGDDVEDTWRNIKVDNTEKLGSGISTGALNFISQNANAGDVSFTYDGGIKASAKMPSIPSKDSDLTNDRYVRYDINSQGLTDVQKSNARTNIGALPDSTTYLASAVASGHTLTITPSTGSDITFTDTTYSEATTSATGLMSASDKTKLDGIATGAQVNVIETVKVNGTALTVTSKAVDVIVPQIIDYRS